MTDIGEEVDLLISLLNKEVDKLGSKDFIQRIKVGLSLSKDRVEFLRFYLNNLKKQKDIYATADVLRCILKKIYESQDNVQAYYDLNLSEHHINSNGDSWEFDPCKNGHNLLKHGLGFSEVASYSGGSFGRYICYTKSGVRFEEGEEVEDPRLVYFSKYDNTYSQNVFLFDKYKDKNSLCIASIGTGSSLKVRFISSRALKVDNEEQLKLELQNLIKDENLDKEVIEDLRASGMRILKEFFEVKTDKS